MAAADAFAVTVDGGLGGHLLVEPANKVGGHPRAASARTVGAALRS
ncbi:hypothetical protein J2S46_007538 [Kitasatospora herbaricolor]|nr:hypothetical protein [Kitasatospora herbaricolor]